MTESNPNGEMAREIGREILVFGSVKAVQGGPKNQIIIGRFDYLENDPKFRNDVKGQMINVQSFDGKIQTINVSQDTDRDILTIATPKDTLHVKNCIEIEEAVALNKNFVKIIYLIKAGSDIQLRRMIILTSINNKLYQSLHITAMFNEDYIDFSKKHASFVQSDKSSRYEIKIDFLDVNYPSYKMAINTYKEEKFKDHPQNNYYKKNNFTLRFDTIKNVFYSNDVDISEYFTFLDPKSLQESKQYLIGTFPMIQLGVYNYYYINGEWYEKGYNNHLSKYTYK